MDLKDKQKLKQLILSQIISLEKEISLSELSRQSVELDQTLAGSVSRIDAIQHQQMFG